MPLRALRTAKPAFAAVAVLLLSACGGSASIPSSATPSDTQMTAGTSGTAQWLQPYFNGAHTGFNPLETTLNRSNVGSLTQLWSFPTAAQITDPVIVQTGVAYVNSGDGYLYAVNASTGSLIWKYETYEGTTPQNAPVLTRGLLVVPCLVGGDTQKNAMCGIKAATGKRVWAYYDDCNCLPPAGVSSGVVASGTTAVFDYQDGSTSPSYVAAVDVRSGTRIWASPALPHGPDFWSAAIAGGQVFFSTGSGVCAASLASGTQAWCTNLGSEPSIASANGVVYVNSSNNGVFALNASTGAQLWQYTPTAGNSSGNYDPPAIAHGIVYVSGIGGNGNLYGLNASTGAPIFNTSGAGSSAYTASSPSVANGVVYLQCSNGFCAFNSATGAVLFDGGTPGQDYVSPAIVNGAVYAACGPNSVCAYALPAPRRSNF